MTLSIIHIIIKIVRGSGSEDDDNNIHTCMFTERFERGSHFISMSSMIVQVSVVLKSITLSLLGFPPFRFQCIRTLHGQKRYCACVGIWRKEFNNQSEYLRERTVKWLHRSNAHGTKEIFGLARDFNTCQTLLSNHRIWGFGNIGFCGKMKTGILGAKPFRKRTRTDKRKPYLM